METTTESVWRGRRHAALGLMLVVLLCTAGGAACRSGDVGASSAATPAPTPASGAGWYLAGSALTDDAGTFNFPDREVPVKPAEEGLTHLRLTNGPCDGSPSDFYVYEANLTPPAQGERAWSGELAPVGGPATPLRSTPDAPNAYLESTGIASHVRVTAEGLPPDMSFAVCFRNP